MTSQLLTFFQAPGHYCKQASAADWTGLLAELRKHGLLAKAYFKLQQSGQLEQAPFQVRRQLQSGAKYAAKQQHSLFYELQQLEPMLQQLDCPCLLLKGAAYRALALPVSHGRLFSDIDILVPVGSVASVKNKLFFCGFYEPEMAEYDRQYYLRWSHQQPPLHHFERDSVIDLHHHIFPPASARQLNISTLFEQAVAIPGSGFKAPCPEHLFVHAAVHLFWQEETHRSLKDIIDLNDQFSMLAEQGLLVSLSEQAIKIGAAQAVTNVIYVLTQLFPSDSATDYLKQAAVAAPQRLLCRCFISTLQDNGVLPAVCKALWFIRGHRLKMRWSVLLYHMLAKPLSLLRR
ncbi:nucleotidyltransferase domain-containing protein [Rheinheimera gaetbuli]